MPFLVRARRLHRQFISFSHLPTLSRRLSRRRTSSSSSYPQKFLGMSDSTSNSRSGYAMHSPRNVIRQYPPSPPRSHSSHDSNESLRALELSEGPIDVSRNVRPGRSYSMSGFDFQADLLPLSASLSEPDRGSEVGGEKSISLLNGMYLP